MNQDREAARQRTQQSAGWGRDASLRLSIYTHRHPPRQRKMIAVTQQDVYIIIIIPGYPSPCSDPSERVNQSPFHRFYKLPRRDMH